MSPFLRRLPVPVAPFPAETVNSYVTRLALANHLKLATLADYLRGPGTTRGRPDPGRLAAATGMSRLVLQQALPELDPHRLWPQHGCSRLACRFWAAARGIYSPVRCWAMGYPGVCLRHRRWTGPTVLNVEGQRDLRCMPEVLGAAKRHYRLVREHGLLRARCAYQDALDVTLGWAPCGDGGRHRDRRLRRLSPGPVVLIGDPALHAALYPETVSLACILASPRWVGAAVSADRAHRGRFYSEVARRLDLSKYRPPAVGDPLACWVAREARLVFAKVPPGCRSNLWGPGENDGPT
jgi:hypothetical protein